MEPQRCFTCRDELRVDKPELFVDWKGANRRICAYCYYHVPYYCPHCILTTEQNLTGRNSMTSHKHGKAHQASVASNNPFLITKIERLLLHKRIGHNLRLSEYHTREKRLQIILEIQNKFNV